MCDFLQIKHEWKKNKYHVVNSQDLIVRRKLSQAQEPPAVVTAASSRPALPLTNCVFVFVFVYMKLLNLGKFFQFFFISLMGIVMSNSF